MFELWAAIVTAVFGAVTAIASNAMASKREEEARQANYTYNEMAADAADMRGRSMYKDLQSPEATIQQLNKAGLSPSLYYAGSTSSQGASTGAMGAGVNGVNPTSYGMNLGNPVQAAQQVANVENVKADTELKKEQANELRGDNASGSAKIKKLLAEAGLADAETALTQAEKVTKDFENWLNDNTKSYQVQTAERYADKLYNENLVLSEELRSARSKANVDEATQKELIKQSALRTKQLIKQNILLDNDIELTEAQTRQIDNAINIAWYELENHQQEAEAARSNAASRRIEVWQQAQQFEKTLKIELDKLEWKKTSDTMNVVAKLVASFAVLAL